ncbi:hypothetical protein [Bradyrhizobium sp.]|uniref:hypothetical protein n=1 Tax=Bradyrhizobium sp. TaxID=376 RepID=UPI003C379C15
MKLLVTDDFDRDGSGKRENARSQTEKGHLQLCVCRLVGRDLFRMVRSYAPWLSNRAVSSLGPKAAAAIIALVPVGAAVFGIPVLDELPSSFSSVAIAVIAAAVMLAARSGQSLSTKGENA